MTRKDLHPCNPHVRAIKWPVKIAFPAECASRCPYLRLPLQFQMVRVFLSGGKLLSIKLSGKNSILVLGRNSAEPGHRACTALRQSGENVKCPAQSPSSCMQTHSGTAGLLPSLFLTVTSSYVSSEHEAAFAGDNLGCCRGGVCRWRKCWKGVPSFPVVKMEGPRTSTPRFV